MHAARGYERVELEATHKLHADIIHVPDLKSIVEPDDIWVLEYAESLHLILDNTQQRVSVRILHRELRLEQIEVNAFESALPLGAVVEGFINIAAHALSYQLLLHPTPEKLLRALRIECE